MGFVQRECEKQDSSKRNMKVWSERKRKRERVIDHVLCCTLCCVYLLPEKVKKPKTRATIATTAGSKGTCQNLKD